MIGEAAMAAQYAPGCAGLGDLDGHGMTSILSSEQIFFLIYMSIPNSINKWSSVTSTEDNHSINRTSLLLAIALQIEIL
jgi:hypothetical protein